MDFKYGDLLIKGPVWWPSRFRTIPFRFRMDPVPGIHKYSWGFHCFYKNGFFKKRERSLWFDHKEYVRTKRSPKSLPNPWDDYVRGDLHTRRSWKNKKIQKQWMKHLK